MWRAGCITYARADTRASDGAGAADSGANRDVQ
jgi:hypothetical protein